MGVDADTAEQASSLKECVFLGLLVLNLAIGGWSY